MIFMIFQLSISANLSVRRTSLRDLPPMTGICLHKIYFQNYFGRSSTFIYVSLRQRRHLGGGGIAPKEKEKKERKKKKEKEKRKQRKKKGTMNSVKLLHIKWCFFQFFNSPVALKNEKNVWPPRKSWNDAPGLRPSCRYPSDCSSACPLVLRRSIHTSSFRASIGPSSFRPSIHSSIRPSVCPFIRPTMTGCLLKYLQCMSPFYSSSFQCQWHRSNPDLPISYSSSPGETK